MEAREQLKSRLGMFVQWGEWGAAFMAHELLVAAG